MARNESAGAPSGFHSPYSSTALTPSASKACSRSSGASLFARLVLARLSHSHRFLCLVDKAFVRLQRLEQALPDLVAHHHHGGACARGGIGAASHRCRRQITVADENRNLFEGDAELFGRGLTDHGIGAGADLMAGDFDSGTAIPLQPHARRRWRHLRRVASGGAAISDQPVAVGHRFRPGVAISPAESLCARVETGHQRARRVGLAADRFVHGVVDTTQLDRIHVQAGPQARPSRSPARTGTALPAASA